MANFMSDTIIEMASELNEYVKAYLSIDSDVEEACRDLSENLLEQAKIPHPEPDDQGEWAKQEATIKLIATLFYLQPEILVLAKESLEQKD